MIRRLIAAVCLAALFAPSALADAMAHYDAYQKALQEGRRADAIAEGLAAWRAAEAEWGEVTETTVLAYNAASLMVRSGKAKEALEPANRALEMAEKGVGTTEVPVLDAALVLGISQSAQDDDNPNVDQLLATLEARGGTGAPADDLTVLGWLMAAKKALLRNRWSTAIEYSSTARAIAEGLGPEARPLASEAAIIEGSSLLIRDKFAKAHSVFDAALHAYDKDIDSAITDKIYARVIVWHGAAAALHRYHEPNRLPELLEPKNKKDEDSGEKSADDWEERGRPIDDGECGHWVDRGEISYPKSDLNKGRISAVLAVYRFGPDGRVAESRILASVPEGHAQNFEESALDAMNEQFLAEIPADAPDSCFRERTMEYQWVFGR